MVAAALLEAAEKLLRSGLRQDYRRHRQIQPVLRGRLDVVRQATARYGQLDQLHTVAFDRDVDIWENRVLHTALDAASRIVSEPALARALTTTAVAFPVDATRKQPRPFWVALNTTGSMHATEAHTRGHDSYCAGAASPTCSPTQDCGRTHYSSTCRTCGARDTTDGH